MLFHIFIKKYIFCISDNKTARALKLSTLRDLAGLARKGFMTKTAWRPRFQDLLDLIVGTYVKSLKAPPPLWIYMEETHIDNVIVAFLTLSCFIVQFCNFIILIGVLKKPLNL